MDLPTPVSMPQTAMGGSCDDPLTVHKFCSMLPSFVFEARPVVPVMDAVRVEQEAMAFRDAVDAKRG